MRVPSIKQIPQKRGLQEKTITSSVLSPDTTKGNITAPSTSTTTPPEKTRFHARKTPKHVGCNPISYVQ